MRDRTIIHIWRRFRNLKKTYLGDLRPLNVGRQNFNADVWMPPHCLFKYRHSNVSLRTSAPDVWTGSWQHSYFGHSNVGCWSYSYSLSLSLLRVHFHWYKKTYLTCFLWLRLRLMVYWKLYWTCERILSQNYLLCQIWWKMR